MSQKQMSGMLLLAAAVLLFSTGARGYDLLGFSYTAEKTGHTD
jgi:hypothetical protein